MFKSIRNLGEVGAISDTDPRSLPDNAFSTAQNVSFIDNNLVKSKGESEVFTAPAVDPYWLLPIQISSTYYWVYPGLTKCYVTDGTTNTNITRQTASVDVDYSADADIGWNGGILGSVPIINNGVDDPQMWTPAGTGTKLQSLTWSSGNTWISESNTARVIRPFKQFLIALHLTESGTEYRQRIRWSHPADSGSVPATWDETDTTKDAGVHDLEEGGGSVIDCLPLRDTNIIYKDNKTIGMQHIGGQFVFRFYDIFESTGILTRRCVKSFFGKHFVVTNGDVIVHDGNTFDSVINHRKKRELFALIDATNYQRTYVSPNYQKNEMWICFPKTGSTFADTAFVWNFKDDTWTTRELPDAKHIGYGLVDPSEADTWASTTDTWDLVDGAWGELSYSPAIIKNLIAGTNKFYLADDTEQFDGVSMTAYAERQGLDFGEPDKFKRVTRIWPRIDASGDITISIGSQTTNGEAVAWKNYTFSDGDEKIDCDVTGRFISYRIESTTNVTWTMQNLDFEYSLKGRF